jgi:hypothetical protein
VAIGTARADTLNALAHGREGWLALTVLSALLVTGIAGMTAALTQRH